MNKSLLFVSPEVFPFAKTSGIADYSFSLPKVLKKRGMNVTIVMPKYKVVEARVETLVDFPIKIGSRKETCIIRKGEIQQDNFEIPIYFIDNYHYFDRSELYGYDDDGERFAFFCNAVVEFMQRFNVYPDIIHLNDWETGLIAALIRNGYKRRQVFNKTASVFTIHNIHEQGNFTPDILKYINLEEDIFDVDGIEFYGDVSFLKAGIVFSDLITTVSKTYAKEIQQAEYGERMEGILRKRKSHLKGILNGIDYDIYNPKTTPYIKYPYSLKDISDKVLNKYYLQELVGFDKSDKMLLGMVSKINEQKGFGILVEVLERLLKKDIQIIILGEGDKYYQRILQDISLRYNSKMKLFLKFDTPLAQLIYAGSDAILLPSKTEPCGMAHMIALRYGSIPIARLTGGLADSITEFSEEDNDGNGFLFLRYSPEEFYSAIERAEYYYNKKEYWQRIIYNAMSKNLSWEKTAQEYIEVYESAISSILA
ncbi:glycogen synthase [Caldicellulosiruptoraceae bacterium PP1]